MTQSLKEFMAPQLESPPKLLPPIPMSIVCPSCKQETGFTKEDILKMTIDDDIRCPSCNHVIYSCLPVKPVYKTTYGGQHYDYMDEYS